MFHRGNVGKSHSSTSLLSVREECMVSPVFEYSCYEVNCMQPFLQAGSQWTSETYWCTAENSSCLGGSHLNGLIKNSDTFIADTDKKLHHVWCQLTAAQQQWRTGRHRQVRRNRTRRREGVDHWVISPLCTMSGRRRSSLLSLYKYNEIHFGNNPEM